MACGLTAPSHYLINVDISSVMFCGPRPRPISLVVFKVSIHKMGLTCICKIISTPPRGQWVNHLQHSTTRAFIFAFTACCHPTISLRSSSGSRDGELYGPRVILPGCRVVPGYGHVTTGRQGDGAVRSQYGGSALPLHGRGTQTATGKLVGGL